MLFALRLALGLTEGPGFPGAAQTAQRILPASERERGFGVLFTGSSFGAMLVPPLATLVFRHAGWRAAFLLTSAAGLLWIPLWMAVTRSRDVRAQLDLPAATATHLTHPAAPRPSFLELVSHPLLLRALCAISAAAPVFSFPQTWGAKYLVRTFGVTQGDVGHYLWLPPLIFDAGTVLFGDLASRQRRAEGAPPRMLFAIGAALAGSLVLLPLVETPWQSIVVLGVSAAGAGTIYALVTSDLLARMPPGSTSLAVGIIASAQSLALVIVNPVIGRTVDRLHSYSEVAISLAAWVIPGSLVWLCWRPAIRFASRRSPAHATG
jgi:ACS family hexuronate transporter-like MFS transporter